MMDAVAASLLQYATTIAASMGLCEWYALPLRKPWGKRLTMLLWTTILGRAGLYVGLITAPVRVDSPVEAAVFSLFMGIVSVALSAGLVSATKLVRRASK